MKVLSISSLTTNTGSGRNDQPQCSCCRSSIKYINPTTNVTLVVKWRILTAKAFDKVYHRKLIQKVQTFPTHNRIIRLVGSYLMSRTQTVGINNVFSSDIDVTSGVPEGSVLGPLLFTFFVNDLPGAVAFGDCVMYADHFKIFSRNSIALDFDVKRIRKRCFDNSMQLNLSKCKLLDYNSSFIDSALCASLNNSSSQKDLGVMMSRDLKWDLHAENRCRKAKQCFFLLKRRLQQTASLLCKLNAYRAFLVPILTYAIPVWYVNCGKCVRLEFIQKREMRWIVASAIEGQCSSKDTYRHLKLLPLSLCLELHDIFFLLQIFHSEYDIDFADFLTMKPEGRPKK